MKKLKILVVDDIFSNRFLLTELIGILGHEFSQAENGEQAVALMQQEDFDLVLMDLEMPVMNGLETTSFIRKNLPFPKNNVPVVALTAHNPNFLFEDYRAEGFDELITKPYSINKIEELINNLYLR